MATLPRRAPDEVRKDRHVLSLKTWRSWGSSYLAGEHSNSTDEVDKTQRIAAHLYAARNAWDIGRRARGLFSPDGVRISRTEAERRLKRAMAELAIGGEP